MSNRLYLNLLISLTILLVGYHYATLIPSYWGNNIVNILSKTLAGLFLIDFSFKKLPEKIDIKIDYKYLLPISFGIVGLCLVNYFIPALIGKLINSESNNNISNSITNLPRFLIMMVLTVFLEEMYYRRIIAQKIFNEKGFSKALWISALIFSFGHLLSGNALMSAFLGGLVLSYIFLKTKSLFLSFITHLIYNYTALLFVVPILNENTNFWNSYQTITLLILIGVLFLVLMFYVMKKTTEREIIKPAGNSGLKQ